jgi:hypothetical protein
MFMAEIGLEITFNICSNISEAPPQTDEKLSPTEMKSHRTASRRSAFWRIFLISFLWHCNSVGENVNKFCN